MKTEESIININMKKVFTLTLLFLLVTTAPSWAKDPFGFVDVCTGHHGSIFLDLWALDEDDLNAQQHSCL
ncbi:MAG: hypothetical protein IKZ48_09500 [Prevotella sp.]|nr:hypothetical protein [Prevotella sp.]